jgi:hypothetical protein
VDRIWSTGWLAGRAQNPFGISDDRDVGACPEREAVCVLRVLSIPFIFISFIPDRHFNGYRELFIQIDCDGGPSLSSHPPVAISIIWSSVRGKEEIQGEFLVAPTRMTCNLCDMSVPKYPYGYQLTTAALVRLVLILLYWLVHCSCV